MKEHTQLFAEKIVGLKVKVGHGRSLRRFQIGVVAVLVEIPFSDHYYMGVEVELFPVVPRQADLSFDFWHRHTNAWEIPGTEDLKPYITAKDKGKKWLFGTIGMAVISTVLAAIMMIFVR